MLEPLRSLTTLYFHGNPCIKDLPAPQYQRLMLAHAPRLEQLDADSIEPAAKAAVSRKLEM